MEQLFTERTKRHQALVQKNLLRMVGYLDLPFALLNELAAKHDQSKFIEPERTAYIWLTWFYHCKNQGIPFHYPAGVDAVVFYGWQHHIHSNLHHPEAHASPDTMCTVDIVEMVCDWTAISQEQNLNGGSCMQWAKLNMAKKWHFSAKQKDRIWATIRELDKRNQEGREDLHCSH
jgi:hypothetical protein